MELIELAILFRAISFLSHHAHNLSKGQTFFEDHVFFGDIYEKADSFYDDLIERYIGTVGDGVDLKKILSESSDIATRSKGEFYKEILSLLEFVIKKIDGMCKQSKYSQGTLNLLQGQSDQVEVLIYKIKRKLK